MGVAGSLRGGNAVGICGQPDFLGHLPDKRLLVCVLRAGSVRRIWQLASSLADVVWSLSRYGGA